mgnify:CR=1 FL=1
MTNESSLPPCPDCGSDVTVLSTIICDEPIAWIECSHPLTCKFSFEVSCKAHRMKNLTPALVAAYQAYVDTTEQAKPAPEEVTNGQI